MIAHALRYLHKQGVDTVLVNVHHKGSQIIEYLSNHPSTELKVYISDERDELKDTGGALVAAKKWISAEEDVIICNVDVLTNLNLTELLHFHRENGADATLVVQQRASTRQLALNAGGQLLGWINHKSGEVIGDFDSRSLLVGFTGIWIVNGRLVHAFADQYGAAPFPVIPALLGNIKNHKIMGWIPPESTIWLEAGNPERLECASVFLKNNPGLI